MSCSPARLAANLRNAQRSTGPKTEAGKAAARLNAFVHGMAGVGDLVAPDEDRDLIDRRERSFAAELQAKGDAGRLLARRAAVLSVRMERAADRDLTATAEARQAGREEFDRDRAEALAEVIARVEVEADGPTVREFLKVLEATPEGAAYLVDAWKVIGAGMDADDAARRAASTDRATLWLNFLPDATGAPDLPALRERADAEVKRLVWLGLQQEGTRRRVAAAREQAGLLAGFDPSYEATLARRYEAAAERGMYRAFDGIAALNRRAGVEPVARTVRPPDKFDLPLDDFDPIDDLGPIDDLAANPPAPAPRFAASPDPSASHVAAAEPLGSFRAASRGDSSPLLDAILRPSPPSLEPVPTRRQRPDLRKLNPRR